MGLKSGKIKEVVKEEPSCLCQILAMLWFLKLGAIIICCGQHILFAENTEKESSRRNTKSVLKADTARFL
jgi:hypothetical protein